MRVGPTLECFYENNNNKGDHDEHMTVSSLVIRTYGNSGSLWKQDNLTIF